MIGLFFFLGLCYALPLWGAYEGARELWLSDVEVFGWPRTLDLIAGGIIGATAGMTVWAMCVAILFSARPLPYLLMLATYMGIGIGGIAWLIRLDSPWPRRGRSVSWAYRRLSQAIALGLIVVALVGSYRLIFSHSEPHGRALMALQLGALATILIRRGQAERRTLPR